MAKTGPNEVTYYGTADERPEGLPEEVATNRVTNINGIRYLYITGNVGAIPPEAFAHSEDLETVHFKSCPVTNIAARAFADSPKLNLVVFETAAPLIASDAFDGCAPSLCGATVGIPVTVSYGITTGSNTTVYATKKISLDARALPVDGLFDTHIFLCDDELNRRLHIEGDFLWSEEEEGANALMYIGESRDVFVPETLGGRPVVTLGRWLLHHHGGFEYRILATPASVRKVSLSPVVPRVQMVFATGAFPYEIKYALSPNTVVYGTTPDEKTGRLVPSPSWNGKEVVVPKGTDPQSFFAAMGNE